MFSITGCPLLSIRVFFSLLGRPACPGDDQSSFGGVKTVLFCRVPASEDNSPSLAVVYV